MVSEANSQHDDQQDSSAEILGRLSDLDEESGQRHRPPPGHLRRLASHRDFAILLVAVALFIVFAVFGRHFLTERTMIDIARRAAILGVLAVGMTFLFISGELDLSIGSHYGFLLILISYGNERLGIDPALASLVAVGIGMAIGAINGFFVTRIGLPSFIMTLGMLALLRGAANAVSSGYPIPAKNTDLPFYQIIRQSFFGTPVPNMFVAMLAVAAIGAVILALTKFGSDVYATGGNVVAAQNSGINTKRVKFRCFVAMGGLCGVAAALLFGRIGLAPLSAGINLELPGYRRDHCRRCRPLWRSRHYLRQPDRRAHHLHDHERADPDGCEAVLGRCRDRRGHPDRRRHQSVGSSRRDGPARRGLTAIPRARTARSSSAAGQWALDQERVYDVLGQAGNGVVEIVARQRAAPGDRARRRTPPRGAAW